MEVVYEKEQVLRFWERKKEKKEKRERIIVADFTGPLKEGVHSIYICYAFMTSVICKCSML